MTKLQKSIQFVYDQEKKLDKHISISYLIGVLHANNLISNEEADYLMHLLFVSLNLEEAGKINGNYCK